MTPKSHRTKYDIINAILNCALTPKRKTEIYYKSKLGGTQYTKYINQLLERGLLKEVPGGMRLQVTTEKGKKFLEAFKQIKALLIVEEG